MYVDAHSELPLRHALELRNVEDLTFEAIRVTRPRDGGAASCAGWILNSITRVLIVKKRLHGSYKLSVTVTYLVISNEIEPMNVCLCLQNGQKGEQEGGAASSVAQIAIVAAFFGPRRENSIVKAAL